MANPRPSGAEWEKWRAKEEAHWAKHNKGSGTYFEFNGERWKLDNKATKGKPRKFSPKSVDAKNTENKKVGGHRERMLEKQTAKDVDPKEAQAARAAINKKGNEHHHKNSRTRVEKGIQAKYGGEIPDHVRKQFADVGEFFGDDPRNFADLTIPEHRTGPNAVHKVEKYMDDAIKGAKGSYQGLDLVNGSFRFMNNLADVPGARSALAAIPFIGDAFAAPDIAAREVKAAQTGNPVDEIQAQLAGAGQIPLAGAVPDLINAGIDMYRGGYHHRRIRGRSGAQKALQQQ